MTDTTRPDGPGAATCTVCSSIPADLLVNTGRDATFPAEVRRLERLELDKSRDIYRCPECGTLFEWEDLPQYYGSGNNDEERLTRLDPAQSAAARDLLDPEPGERDSGALLAQAIATLSPDLVCEILRHLAYTHPQVFAGFLGPIVERLAAKSDYSLSGVVTSYCGLHRDRLVELERRLDAAGAESSTSLEYLRRTATERIAECDRYRGGPPRA